MNEPATMSDHALAYTITEYVNDVSGIMDRGLPLVETVRHVTACKKRLVTAASELPEGLRRIHPTAAYTRNLVHHDPKGRFTVIAIIWGPFQETAVHDHINWCVVGVLSGTAHVVNYDRLDDEATPGRAELRVRDSFMAPQGATAALLPPSRSNLHKMANAGRGPTISIHTYGDPGTRATAFDLRNGTYAPVDLRFHNIEP